MVVQYLHRIFQPVQYAVRRNVNHCQPQTFKKTFPFLVVFPFPVMRSPVDFNDNPAVDAIKIDNAITDDLLTVKIVTLEFLPLNLQPQ